MDIKKSEIDDLLQIIPDNYPSINIYHISSFAFELSSNLKELASKNSYEYDLRCLDSYSLNRLKSCNLNATLLDINKHRYNEHAKLYDFLFLTIDLDKIEEKMLFLKKIYAIMKNGAKLIIISKGVDQVALSQLLEDSNFVAINPIINTFQNYDILSAQKMHGWGS
jgi:hypothetical protein